MYTCKLCVWDQKCVGLSNFLLTNFSSLFKIVSFGDTLSVVLYLVVILNLDMSALCLLSLSLFPSYMYMCFSPFHPPSAMEAAFILSNLARHSAYIKATATHLLSHVRSNEDMIGPHLLPNERDRLTSDLSEAATAVSSLQDEVLTLQREVNLVGPHIHSSCCSVFL